MKIIKFDLNEIKEKQDAKRDTSHLHLKFKENKKLYLNEYMESCICFFEKSLV